MKNYHVIIAKERRVSTEATPRDLAYSSPARLETQPIDKPVAGNPNILFACEWDGAADHITVLIGTMADRTVALAGWPDTDIPAAV